MSTPITIVTPEFPPTRGGLADYTARVMEHWPTPQDFDVVIPTPGKSFALNAPMLVQYSAYGFDRFGYPRRLIDELVAWRQKSHNRLCIMFHEIWAFWPWWNKNFPVQWAHRRAIARLLQTADAVFTSTANQADFLSELGDVHVGVLPVGANISPDETFIAQPEVGTAVIFGMASTRLRVLREMAGELSTLARVNRLRRVITVGDLAHDDTERTLLGNLRLSAGFEQLGGQLAATISTLFATAEFGIAAQDPLSYTKSGTFMAYAAHGLNILSPHAHPAAAAPGCWLTSPAELAGGVDAAELRARAGKLRDWSEETASWKQIAGTFARALQATP